MHELISLPALSSVHAGLKLSSRLPGSTLFDLQRESLKRVCDQLSGQGDDLVKQVAAFKLASGCPSTPAGTLAFKESLSEIFNEFADITSTADSPFWGEVLYRPLDSFIRSC